MDSRSIAPLAVFLDFELFALLLLVNRSRVIASLALGACESDNICHSENFPSRKNMNACILAQARIFA